MNLTTKEKKEIVEAYKNNDLENLQILYAKAKGNPCNSCTSYLYIKQWMEYWFANGDLKK